MGSHPTILVGLYGGIIIKQNSAASQSVVFAEVLVPPVPSTLDSSLPRAPPQPFAKTAEKSKKKSDGARYRPPTSLTHHRR
jgi:hypothetical protein